MNIIIKATVYGKFHDEPARVWITFDKKEIVSASDVTYHSKHEELYQQMKKERHLKGIPYNLGWDEMFHSKEREELVKTSDDVEEIMINQNIFNSYPVSPVITPIINKGIEEIPNPC